MTAGYEPHAGQSTGGPEQQPAVPGPAGAQDQSTQSVPPRPGPLPPRMVPPVPPHPAGPYVPPASVTAAPPSTSMPPTPIGPGMPMGPAMPARRNRLAGVALLLAAVLALVTAVQAYQINRLGDRLSALDRRLAEAQSDDRARLDELAGRTDALEKQAGKAFNPEAIADAVLPSVFRVRAGDFTGTAFAVGGPTPGGGTNLFTNFHVVKTVWETGDRRVFLERTGQRFPARIVKVDEANDIAQLTTDSKFTGLVTAAEPVKPGQQIVVVGAPLGLEDTVTTGVVSAFRKDDDGTGDMIQFDAPINPGNSGGPVINAAKEVVGIATAKAQDAEGIGLAVPIGTACGGFKLC